MIKIYLRLIWDSLSSFGDVSLDVRSTLKLRLHSNIKGPVIPK